MKESSKTLLYIGWGHAAGPCFLGSTNNSLRESINYSATLADNSKKGFPMIQNPKDSLGLILSFFEATNKGTEELISWSSWHACSMQHAAVGVGTVGVQIKCMPWSGGDGAEEVFGDGPRSQFWLTTSHCHLYSFCLLCARFVSLFHFINGATVLLAFLQLLARWTWYVVVVLGRTPSCHQLLTVDSQ